jgi:hypothetical protein
VTKSRTGKIAGAEYWEDLDKYYAVSICCGDEACSAARELSGQRYLEDEAPGLPLPRCDADRCNCVLASHRDRRSFLKNRRPNRTPDAGNAGRLLRGNRRSGQDRRALKVDFS